MEHRQPTQNWELGTSQIQEKHHLPQLWTNTHHSFSAFEARENALKA